VSLILIGLKSNPGGIPGCMNAAMDTVQGVVLDAVQHCWGLSWMPSRISHGSNMDEPGTCSWMTWEQVALVG